MNQPDPAEQLAGLRRAMTAIGNDQTTPAEYAAQAEADRELARRVHAVRPGVPLHHVFAVVQALRAVQAVDAAKASPADRAVVRAETLREAIAAVEDPQERAKATTGSGLGWEAARDVLLRRLAGEQPAPLRAEFTPFQLLAGQPDEPISQTERVVGVRRLAGEQPAQDEAPCPGFPERCPNLRTVEPNPPEHYGGIRCGCGDQPPSA